MAIASNIADLLIQTLTKATSHIRMNVNIYRHTCFLSLLNNFADHNIWYLICKPLSMVLFPWLCIDCVVDSFEANNKLIIGR